MERASSDYRQEPETSAEDVNAAQVPISDASMPDADISSSSRKTGSGRDDKSKKSNTTSSEFSESTMRLATALLSMPEVQGHQDVWREEETAIIRFHNRPRTQKFVPTDDQGLLSRKKAKRYLNPNRLTAFYFLDDPSELRMEEDERWQGRGEHEEVKGGGGQRWVGVSVFFKKDQKVGQQLLPPKFTPKDRNLKSLEPDEEESSDDEQQEDHKRQTEQDGGSLPAAEPTESGEGGAGGNDPAREETEQIINAYADKQQQINEEEMLLDALDEMASKVWLLSGSELELNEDFQAEVQGMANEEDASGILYPSSVEPAIAAETPSEKVERLRRKALYKFMLNEHKSLGHGAAAELLYEGEALKILKEIRSKCRLCNLYDDTRIIKNRGALCQFAADKNQLWLIDEVPTRLGNTIKIIDACSRKRVAVLIDVAPSAGGKVGAAVRCFQKAKDRLGGAPETLLYDMGSEFDSRRFRRAVEASNTGLKPVGFKAAWRISKLERDNGSTRKRLNKLINPPFAEWLEVFLWGMASHAVDQELLDFNFSDVMNDLCRAPVDADEQAEEYVIKEMLLDEAMWQLNHTPVLGTTLSPENLHTGSFNRGTRDWELVLGELLNDHEIKLGNQDAYMERSAAVQEAVREAVRSLDLELLARRRELVGRSYWRGKEAESFEIGMKVYCRKPETSKFHRWMEGTVTAVDGEKRLVHVQIGKYVGAYVYKDVAVLAPLQEQEYELEFYPDDDLLDMIVDKGGCVIFEDENETVGNTELTPLRHVGLGCREATTADVGVRAKFGRRTGVSFDAGVPDMFLGPRERLFEYGKLHKKVLSEVQKSRTSVELSMHGGSVFLADAVEVPDSTTQRAFDFDVLQPLTTSLETMGPEEKRAARLMRGENQMCFQFSQLLNGRCIQKELSIKDNSDIHYAVVSVDVARERLKGSVDRGRHCNLRWGPSTTPLFISDAEAAATVPNTFVARRSYTVGDATLLAVFQFAQAMGSKMTFADFKEAFLSGKLFKELYDEAENQEVWVVVPEAVVNMTIPGVTMAERDEVPIGATAVHVDDSAACGHVIFYLRLAILYEYYELGSFTVLEPGTRDNYVGREIIVVPRCFDDYLVEQHLLSQPEQLEKAGLEFPRDVMGGISEEEYQTVEQATGIGRETEASDYPLAKSRTLDAEWFADNNEVPFEIVYHVSQASYAKKLQELTAEEVNTYFQKRGRATNKWLRRQLKSPIKGRIGELIWLEKTNSIIHEAVSVLAGQAHAAEQQSSYDEIAVFVEELSNLILIAQLPETNVRRVFWLGKQGEVFMCGAADAGMERTGSIPFLASLRSSRINGMAMALLMREQLLSIRHIDGAVMFADALTKHMVYAHVFLLHLAMSLGIVDVSILRTKICRKS
eukprot:g19432.t1